MQTTKMNCLPVYILIDTSASMSQYQDALNQSIEDIYDELITSPLISEFARVSILSYNTDATVVMTMTDLLSLTALPQVACGGVTNFERVLDLLKERIDVDVAELKSAGREVLRPVAFLLTDGVPTDETGHPSDRWKGKFAAMTSKDQTRRPNVIPFGYGGADAQDLLEVSTIPGATFIAEPGSTGAAIRDVIPALLNSLVASAQQKTLMLPSEVDGFIRVSPEVVE